MGAAKHSPAASSATTTGRRRRRSWANSTKLSAEKIEDLDDLFWRAHVVAKREPAALARMDAFLKLYGFARNIAFVALVGAVGLIIAAAYESIWGDPTTASQKAVWAALSLIIGLGMLERYLKFYRLFGLEVLVTLAHNKDESQ